MTAQKKPGIFRRFGGIFDKDALGEDKGAVGELAVNAAEDTQTEATGEASPHESDPAAQAGTAAAGASASALPASALLELRISGRATLARPCRLLRTGIYDWGGEVGHFSLWSRLFGLPVENEAVEEQPVRFDELPLLFPIDASEQGEALRSDLAALLGKSPDALIAALPAVLEAHDEALAAAADNHAAHGNRLLGGDDPVDINTVAGASVLDLQPRRYRYRDGYIDPANSATLELNYWDGRQWSPVGATARLEGLVLNPSSDIPVRLLNERAEGEPIATGADEVRALLGGAR